MKSKMPELQRNVGIGGAATFAALLILGYVMYVGGPDARTAGFFSHPTATGLSILLLSFGITAVLDHPSMRSLQIVALVGFGLAVIVMSSNGSLTGLPIVGLGVILSAEHGFFRTYRPAKLVIVVAGLLGSLFLQAVAISRTASISALTLTFAYNATAVIGLTIAYVIVIRDAAYTVAERQAVLEKAVELRSHELKEQVHRTELAQAVAQKAALEAEALASERLELLREVHHRAKNSLQMTLTLLEDFDRESPDAMATTINRVRAIGLVYDLIDSARDLSAISLEDYIERLVGYIGMSYASAPVWIEYVHSDDDYLTRLEPTINLGLMLHEIIATIRLNSLSDSGGAIELVQKSDGDSILFTITHSGKPLGDQRAITEGGSSSSGLLPAILERLHVDITVTSGDQNLWKLEIPKEVLAR